MSQYNNISVFKAKPSENPKAPAFNVIIEMANGEKFRGGLWKKTSAKGTDYLAGALEPDAGEAKQRQPRPEPKQDLVDW